MSICYPYLVPAATGDQPQFPNLLDGYATRPAWQVAGVDYYVGVPSTTVFKHPATETLPSGVSRSVGGHTYTVTGNNVVLDGYDFGEDGGWQIIQTTGNNLTISNCQFKSGVNNLYFINCFDASPTATITVSHCTFDCQRDAHTGVDKIGFFHTATVEYCYIFDTYADAIVFTGAGGAEITLGACISRKNLFYRMGAGGGHADVHQFQFCGCASFVQEYNTWYQPLNHDTTSNAFLRCGDQDDQPISNVSSQYNTIVLKLGDTGIEVATIWQMGGGAAAATGVNYHTHENYCDPTGVTVGAYLQAFYLTPPEVVNPVTYGNINMTDGSTMRWGPFNSHTASIPGSSPSAPVISTATPVGSTVALVGTSGNNLFINLYVDGVAEPATIQANGAGAWTYTTGTLSAGLHSFQARASDATANSSALSSIVTATV